jgi:hypothetical protein
MVEKLEKSINLLEDSIGEYFEAFGITMNFILKKQ